MWKRLKTLTIRWVKSCCTWTNEQTDVKTGIVLLLKTIKNPIQKTVIVELVPSSCGVSPKRLPKPAAHFESTNELWNEPVGGCFFEAWAAWVIHPNKYPKFSPLKLPIDPIWSNHGKNPHGMQRQAVLRSRDGCPSRSLCWFFPASRFDDPLPEDFWNRKLVGLKDKLLLIKKNHPVYLCRFPSI